MAERLAKVSMFGEYTPYHFTASQANTALDANSHGHFLGHVCINTLGTSTVITLSNGTSTTSTNIFAVITPLTTGSIDYEGICDRGLWITIAGSGMDITIMANDMAV